MSRSVRIVCFPRFSGNEGEHVVKEWWEVAGFTVAAGRWLGKDYDVGRNEHA